MVASFRAGGASMRSFLVAAALPPLVAGCAGDGGSMWSCGLVHIGRVQRCGHGLDFSSPLRLG